MDKKQQNTDSLLSKVLKQCEDDPNGQELKFIETVFDFLNRRSSFLAQPGASNKVLQLIHNHINIAKKKEIKNQSFNEKKTSGITDKTKKSITEKEAKVIENKDKEKEKQSSNDNESKEIQSDDTKKMDVDVSDDDSSDVEDVPEGNGGTTDKYKWVQSLDDVEVALQIDANLRGKHLNIKITKKRLFIAIKGKESTPIIDGELHDTVNVDESTWTLDKEHNKTTKTLTIILQKVKGMNWWDSVIKGDPKIDTSKIQPENSKLQSLDDETRQTVEKMMFDQRQKMKGLPTSKELEQQKMLEKFKAQHPEMDFSNLKMPQGAMGGMPGMSQ